MIHTLTIGELIQRAREHPPEAIVEGLLFADDIFLIHGEEESYKSIFVFQLADNIASGTPVLGRFSVPQARRVGILETELHESQLGERLDRMFGKSEPAQDLYIFGDMESFRKAPNMDKRLNLVCEWVQEQSLEVLFLDIANDFFRGASDNPKDEGAVAVFFERLRAMGVTCGVVRHDHKPRMEDFQTSNSNNRIRGSGEWKEDPEVVLWLERQDRRTNQVNLEVGKLRYGRKPEPMKPWFDVDSFRLTLLPPVVAVLASEGRRTRRQLLEACQRRFGLASRKTDELVGELTAFLRTSQMGHEKAFELDIEMVQAPEEEWTESLIWREVISATVNNGCGEEICKIA